MVRWSQTMTDNDDNGIDVPDPAKDIERDLAEARRPIEVPDPTEDLDEE